MPQSRESRSENAKKMPRDEKGRFRPAASDPCDAPESPAASCWLLAAIFFIAGIIAALIGVAIR